MEFESGTWGPENLEGFGKEGIEGIRDKVQELYRTVVEEDICLPLKNNLITPISQVWFTQEGKDFFDSFAETVKSTSEGIKSVYQGFIDNLQEAGNKWHDVTKNEAPALTPLETITIEIGVDAIQAVNAKGQAVINIDGANQVAKYCPTLRQDIEDKIKNRHDTLATDEGFIGGGQAEAITAFFSQISKYIGDIFKFIDEGGKNSNGDDVPSLMESIQHAAENQETMARTIANAYQNAANGNFGDSN